MNRTSLPQPSGFGNPAARQDLQRRRGQRKGHVYRKGPSWIVRWREDITTATGELARAQVARVIAPAAGPGAVSKREAQRIAWDEILSKLDQNLKCPASIMTVDEFIRTKFERLHLPTLKPSGKKHYRNQLRRVQEQLGSMRMRDVSAELVQRIVLDLIAAGKSTQTAAHFRNTVSAVFRCAKAFGYFAGDNPAAAVRLPEMKRRQLYSLRAEQLQMLIDALPTPVAELAFISATTSMNVAELAGLRWKHVNLTDEFRLADGEAIAPFSLIVRSNNFRGEICTPKTPSRRRAVPLSTTAISMLVALKKRAAYAGDEDFVFANSRGGALNECNLRRRVLAPTGKSIGLPFPLAWHVLRRTHATLAEQVGMPLSDRQAMMGHATSKMTLHYTSSDIERRRLGIEAIDRLIVSGVRNRGVEN